MGGEIRQLHDQLVSLSRSVSEGRYVFSGDLDGQALYTSDWSHPAGVVRSATAENTRKIHDVNGTEFQASRSAHQIFDDQANSVFAAVHALGLAMEANDRAAVEAAVPTITKALEHLNTQLSFYGVTQQRVEASINLNEKVRLLRKEELSSLQDSDMGEALVQFNMARVHHEAALGARARMPTSSLFDYLG
jgi:flagellin-like hook-associated protein FlgL